MRYAQCEIYGRENCSVCNQPNTEVFKWIIIGAECMALISKWWFSKHFAVHTHTLRHSHIIRSLGRCKHRVHGILFSSHHLQSYGVHGSERMAKKAENIVVAIKAKLVCTAISVCFCFFRFSLFPVGAFFPALFYFNPLHPDLHHLHSRNLCGRNTFMWLIENTHIDVKRQFEPVSQFIALKRMSCGHEE